MNCKPGDLAVVVGKCDISGDYLLGHIFKVTSSYFDRGGWFWEYEGPVLGTPWGTLAAVADAKLRPIRDPGDDAVDESFRWVPSPAFERAYAETYGGGA